LFRAIAFGYEAVTHVGNNGFEPLLTVSETAVLTVRKKIILLPIWVLI
jgi:hypothetical protein